MNLVGAKIAEGEYRAHFDEDDFLSRMETAYRGRKTNADKKSPFESINDLLSRQQGAGYSSVSENLERLVNVQAAIDRRMRIDNSSILAPLESMYLQVAGGIKVVAKPKTIDELFNDQLEVIAELSTSARGALTYSWMVREQVTGYRDDVVLAKLSQATAKVETLGEQAAVCVADYQRIEACLANLQFKDRTFARYYKVRSTLQSELMQLGSEKAKADQVIVLRKSELDVLNVYDQLLNYAVLALDRLTSYVDDVAEHARMTQPARQWIRDNNERMGAVYSAFSALSNCVMHGATEMGESLRRMSEMARAASVDNLVPDQLGAILGNYRAGVVNADQRITGRFSQRADAIRNSYGV